MEYKVISPEYLENVTGGDPEITEELVNIFKSQVPEFIYEMKGLYNKGMWYELGLLAHKAKSSVAVMGMDTTATMLKTFELQAKAGENEDAYMDYINQFASEAGVAVEELALYLNKLK
jgi:HPt (histidine-containing phosphotransfer) domain-containing protein